MTDQVKHDEEECALPPTKRKPDSCLIDDGGLSKRSKTATNIADGEQEQTLAFKLQDDDDEEHSNGEADRKGKWIVARDDKGKGKMVEEDDDDSSDDGGGEEEDDDDDDDSSEDDDEDDSDLSDDPLTEVDLDNILPSRTRRRSAASNPGICLGKREDN